MNILVYIKPFTEQKLLEASGIACTNIGENDKAALEIALELKDKRKAHVTALTIGEAAAETQLREAFAMGADAGFLVSSPDSTNVNTLTVAAALKKFKVNLYLTGDEGEKTNLSRIATLVGLTLHKGDGNQLPELDGSVLLLASAENIKPRYMQIAGIYQAYKQEVRQIVF